jgi:3-hydroxybutyryl-CoA dehydratase
MEYKTKFIEDFSVGMESTIEKTVTIEDIKRFAEVSGDFNPVHLDEEFAKKTIFKGRIAHGFLTASFISTIIATELPGPGSIYLKQSLKFLAPVYINEKILVKVRIIEINIEKSKVKLITECFKNKTLVLTGEAEILIQAKKK